MKLNLFNFDVIRDSRRKDRYLIVDINYFPGYAKMPGYEIVFTEFLCDVLCKKQQAGESEECEKDATRIVIDTCSGNDGEDKEGSVFL